MIEKKLKTFGKESLFLSGSGVAFGTLASVDTSGASGSLASGIGKIAPLVSLKLTTGILTDINKKLSKKY